MCAGTRRRVLSHVHMPSTTWKTECVLAGTQPCGVQCGIRLLLQICCTQTLLPQAPSPCCTSLSITRCSRSMGSTDSCLVQRLPRAKAVATVLMMMSCRLHPTAPCSLLDLLRHLSECAGDSVATLAAYSSLFSPREAMQVNACPILACCPPVMHQCSNPTVSACTLAAGCGFWRRFYQAVKIG